MNSNLVTFIACVAAAATALVAQDHLIAEPWNHYIAVLAIVATAVLGVCTKLPRDPEAKSRATDRRTYEGT